MKLLSKLLCLIVVLFVGIGCDQVTKKIAQKRLRNKPPIVLAKGFVRFQYAENTGAFLSLGARMKRKYRFWIFTVLVGASLIGLLGSLLYGLRSMPWVSFISLALVLAGGIGNLWDRVFRNGSVIDFVSMGFGRWRTGIFNLADVYIMGGVIVLFIAMLGEMEKEDITYAPAKKLNFTIKDIINN